MTTELKKAVANLIKVKGRHHTEQAYARLVEAFDAAERAESEPSKAEPAGSAEPKPVFSKFPSLREYQKAMQAWRESAGEIDLSDDGKWQPMLSAPLDGSEVELMIRHNNWIYASGKDREQWEQIVRAKWIDFNGGGWTWHGMAGMPVGWRSVLIAAKGGK